jgi:hypothetical protein
MTNEATGAASYTIGRAPANIGCGRLVEAIAEVAETSVKASPAFRHGKGESSRE